MQERVLNAGKGKATLKNTFDRYENFVTERVSKILFKSDASGLQKMEVQFPSSTEKLHDFY